MAKWLSLKKCDVLKMLCAFEVRVVENNRGYVDFDGIRLVYDFDVLDIVGWYDPGK